MFNVITDVYSKTESNSLLNAKATATTVYTKTEANSSLSAKANTTAVYARTETENLLNEKADTIALDNPQTTIRKLYVAKTATLYDGSSMNLSKATRCVWASQNADSSVTIDGLCKADYAEYNAGSIKIPDETKK